MAEQVSISPEVVPALFDALPDGVVVINSSGRILLVNAAMALLFGYSKTELYGMNIDELVPTHLRAAHAEHRKNYFRQPYLRPMGSGAPFGGLHKNGSVRQMRINLAPLQTPQELLIVATVRWFGA